MPDYNTTAEQELLLLTARGDKAAFAELFERHHRRLGAFVFGISKSHETAEEVVLDVFLKIWMTRETLVDIQQFNAYLFTIARNAAVSALRQRLRQRVREREWQSGTLAATQPFEEDEKERWLTVIDEAIAQLSPQRKRIYLLSREQGLKYEEIAVQLGLSRHTVRAHVQQAVASISVYVREKLGSSKAILFLLLPFL